MQFCKILLLVFAIHLEDFPTKEVETTTLEECCQYRQETSLHASHETVVLPVNKSRNWLSYLVSGNNITKNEQLQNMESGADLNSVGNKLLKQHKYKEAIHYFNEEITKNPTEALLFRNRSYAYIQQKKWIMALKDARKAVELEPEDLKGHFNLGLVWLGLESLNKAIQHLEKARGLAKRQHEFCNTAEIVSTLWSTRRKQRQRQIEEENTQKAELYALLEKLIKENTQHKMEEILVQLENRMSEDTDKEFDAKITTLDSEHDKYIGKLTSIFFKNNGEQSSEIPKHFQDRISFELMKEPVITPSGITYERAQIEKHLKKVGLFDPTTREDTTREDLIPNNAIEAAIDAFLEENDWLVENEKLNN